jgi:peptidoglycan/xylan/chitin deacetylase (PgdA/CDA1 family)
MIKVCQCWDDGVLNDIKVVELCRKYNAKATFNLNPGKHLATTRLTDGWQFRDYYPGKLAWSEVKSVYEGFEVASHGMNHLSAGVVDDKAFVADAVAARKVIEDLFQRECRGFAWPCGKYNAATVQMMHEAGFAYGRTTQYRESVLPCEDFMALHSNCHFLNPNFWDIFEKAKPSGVFYFWGHSYEMMEDADLWKNYEDKLKRLDEDPEVEWINVIDLVSMA